MEEKVYDLIVLGTGFTECILAGLLASQKKLSILQIDRNDYYGGESASLDLQKLFKHFEGEESVPDEKSLGPNKKYNIDLTPKFVMGSGNLVKFLIHTQTQHYFTFRPVKGSFVWKMNDGWFEDKTKGALYKVPSTPAEVSGSNLMGMMQKLYFKSFSQFCLQFDPKDKKTWQKFNFGGKKPTTAAQVYASFGLDETTQAFVGHAVALYLDESYLKKNGADLCSRVRLYARSFMKFRKASSPYIYPRWGLSCIPEGFSRLCARFGGLYMLRRDATVKLEQKDGPFSHIESEEPKEKKIEKGKAKMIITDPSYIAKDHPDMVEKTGQVARWLFILDKPIAGTNGAHSAQIIIPAKHVYGQKRKSDIYMCTLSSEHDVCDKKKYLVWASCHVETKDPKKELSYVKTFFGKPLKDFFWITDTYRAKDPEALAKRNIFVTSSLDASSHFESATQDIMRLYKLISGEELDMSIKADVHAE